jgi:putative DNA primase/helicase
MTKTIVDLQEMAEGMRQRKPQDEVLILPSPGHPMEVARQFVAMHALIDGVETIRHWRGTWWAWRGPRWQEIEGDAMRKALYLFTENAWYWKPTKDDGPELTKWSPNRHKITDLAEALCAVLLLDKDISQPCWLDGRSAGTIVAMTNGLLDVKTRVLLMHTPLYFNVTSVPFPYDASAPEPSKWLEFMEALWPTDVASIDALGEWFGYVISGRLDLHKIMLLKGPTRAGKGVMSRILEALIGECNVCHPTLNSLGGDFGLEPLIGKGLATVADARFSGKNSEVIVERLLSISGEDGQTIHRKYKKAWEGKLPTRLMVISNELPRFGDASAAIIGRFILLMLERSWLGKEDFGLELRLREELPGILNWALEGLQRLVENENVFTATAGAEEALTTMRDLASPVGAFVREQCEVGKIEFEVKVDTLYTEYKTWAESNGQSRPSKQNFARMLHAAFPGIKVMRPRVGEDERVRIYTGIKLRQEANPGGLDFGRASKQRG